MAETSKYTKPKLRERLKKRIMAGSKGGKAGQWSARKAQLVASEYKKAGGGYKGGEGRDSLVKWVLMMKPTWKLYASRIGV